MTATWPCWVLSHESWFSLLVTSRPPWLVQAMCSTVQYSSVLVFFFVSVSTWGSPHPETTAHILEYKQIFEGIRGQPAAIPSRGVFESTHSADCCPHEIWLWLGKHRACLNSVDRKRLDRQLGWIMPMSRSTNSGQETWEDQGSNRDNL